MSYTKNKKSESKNPERIPLLFSGDMRVFPREVGKYLFYGSSFSSKKDKNGDRDVFYFDVQFTKDNNPEIDKPFDIRINKSFFTANGYKNNDGDYITKLVLVVTDFDLI